MPLTMELLFAEERSAVHWGDGKDSLSLLLWLKLISGGLLCCSSVVEQKQQLLAAVTGVTAPS